MRILYVIDQNIEEGKTAGIIHKVKDKILVWASNGLEVELLTLYSFRLYDSQLNEIPNDYTFNLKPHGRYYTLFRMIYSTFLLVFFLRKKKYDMVYMRQRPYMPFTKFALKKQKLVIELNTDDVEEYKTISNVMYIVNKITRNGFYSLAHGFVAVTRNLKKKYEYFNREIFVLANGVEVNNYPIREGKNERPLLCFVGSPGFSWHGLDKIEYMAEKLKKFDFKVIGIDGHDTANIKYLGYMDLEELKKEVQTSDVGISTLSLHKKNMDEACPLKSRQYLAQGLPIIYAYNDTDLQGNEDFALKLPNAPDNIEKSIDEIKEFVDHVFNNKKINEQARKFALEKLDSSKKEELRVKFLKSLKSNL